MVDIATSLPLMAAFAALKRKSPDAYAALLKKLGVDSWAHLDPSRYPAAIVEARARSYGIELDDSEVVDELRNESEEGNAILAAVYSAAYDRPNPTAKTLQDHAIGDTVAAKLNSMSRFDTHARKAAAMRDKS